MANKTVANMVLQFKNIFNHRIGDDSGPTRVSTVPTHKESINVQLPIP